MKKILTITFLIAMIGTLNWSLESIGYNMVSSFFSEKTKNKIVITKTGHFIYFMFSFCALVALIMFFRDGLYKDDKDDEEVPENIE